RAVAETARSRGNNRSVMPFDALGCTRATLKETTRTLPLRRACPCERCAPVRKDRATAESPGLVPNRGRDWGLKLCPTNQEFPVSASQQLALITSLPFVHTARRYY